MDLPDYKRIVLSQLVASLAMLEECVRACPARKWTARVGKYSFWHVAYHTLYCTDVYTVVTEAAWRQHARFHPGGASDVEDEYPSRVMTRRELVDYVAHVRRKVRASVRRETKASLRGPAGFPWLTFTRAELHLYNLRHIQHHVGQLTAFLRRAKVQTSWVKDGE